ncbi:MAG: hypothetical protein IT370_07120 [Deltaproteobacteria bacterium]|nr:hypothetical protein [Deltaproteobacteria bacterium]
MADAPLLPASRFGIAAGLLGVAIGPTLGFLQRFDAELGRRLCVRVGGAADQLTLATRGGGADFTGRVLAFLAEAEPAHATALVRLLTQTPGPTTVQVTVAGQQVAVGLEQICGGPVVPLLDALSAGAAPLLPGAEARALAAQATRVREAIDAVGGARCDGAAVVRAVLAAGDAAPLRQPVLDLLAALQVPAAQRELAAALYGPLSGGGVIVRVGSGPTGVDRVGVEFRNLAADDVVKLWQRVAPAPGLPARFGGLVGALGTEAVAALELTWSRAGAEVQASFELGPEPVTLPLRRAAS